MTVLKFTVALFIAISGISFFVSSCSGYDAYRHEKTRDFLQEDSPLPDIVLDPNDKITPELAYEKATENLNKNGGFDAGEYYQRAVEALRRAKPSCDNDLMRKIILDYGRFLRKHCGAQQASDLETEFLSATSFSKSLDDLQQQYNAPEVVQFFEKAQKNLDGYFWAILTQRVASEHSYPCVFRYREALEDAHKHNWNSARTKIEEAKIESKDLNQHACVADICIASALINKAMGSDQDALSDLRLVYEYRKANPQSWTENSDIFHVPSYVRFP